MSLPIQSNTYGVRRVAGFMIQKCALNEMITELLSIRTHIYSSPFAQQHAQIRLNIHDWPCCLRLLLASGLIFDLETERVAFA